ncbi:MAG: isoaspartyl peptidase/L-asparaginase [Halodesulfurarchaeum sp.]
MEVLVHGGAGDAPEEPDARQSDLQAAVEAARQEETPLDGVETAIRTLETAPRFNAGVGGAVQSDGVPRTDAGLMRSEGSVGAVCSLEGVEHAISAARVVLEETPHVLLAGENASELAADYGIETDVDLWTEASRTRWEGVDEPPRTSRRDHLEWVRRRFGGSDTVGAVAADGDRVAAGTSTGGRWFALAGRVGDVPQVGSGFFANEHGAASATGAGEDIAKTHLTRLAVANLESGLDASSAAERALETLIEETGSHAGVIVMTPHGDVGEATNAESMQTGTSRSLE